MKPHESLPVGRARQELVALRPGLSGRHHAAGRLGAGLQRAAGSQSAGTGLSLADQRIQVRVIPYVTEVGQDGPVLAATAEGKGDVVSETTYKKGTSVKL
jgi:hypothetical protein